MWQPVERPFGITLLSVLVAIKGIASLAMVAVLVTFDHAGSTHADQPAAGVALVGGLLLYRAHGLSKLRRRAWTMMVLLLAIEATAAISTRRDDCSCTPMLLHTDVRDRCDVIHRAVISWCCDLLVL